MKNNTEKIYKVVTNERESYLALFLTQETILKTRKDKSKSTLLDFLRKNGFILKYDIGTVVSGRENTMGIMGFKSLREAQMFAEINVIEKKKGLIIALETLDIVTTVYEQTKHGLTTTPLFADLSTDSFRFIIEGTSVPVLLQMLPGRTNTIACKKVRVLKEKHFL